MELMDYLKSAKESLFRWESLPMYLGDEEDLDYFKKTGKTDTKRMELWWQFLEGKRKEGVLLQRVRLVPEPLNEYVSWELEIHRESVKHGDDIRTISEEEYKNLGNSLPDFWLIDNQTVLDMKYGSQGEYLGFEVKENGITEYVTLKESLLERSKELGS